MQKIKKYLSFIFISLGLVVLNSCNEKIELIGDFVETAVVYGLLDQADSLHYIKINRAFIGPGNALEIAQIADSSYFTNVDATISEYLNGILTRSWLLRDTILDNKDPNGVFYAPEQKVYYFKTMPTGFNGVIQTSTNPQMTSLNPQAIYKIDLKAQLKEIDLQKISKLVIEKPVNLNFGGGFLIFGPDFKIISMIHIFNKNNEPFYFEKNFNSHIEPNVINEGVKSEQKYTVKQNVKSITDIIK